MNVAQFGTRYRFSWPVAVALVIVGGASGATAPSGGGITEVVILGTLHEFHDQCNGYSRTDLRDIIIEADPAAILFEMPPTIGGSPTAIDGRVDPAYESVEGGAVNQAADSLGIPALPYDRDRRNERYQEMRYFEREKYAFERLMEWSSKDGGGAVAAAVGTVMGCVLENVQGAQLDIALHAGPKVVNSSAFDRLTEASHCLVYELVPPLLADAALDTVIADLAFFADEWNTRNSIMANNIERIAGQYVGRRVVVLCGAEHRYILRNLLQGRAGIELKEYFELD